MADQNDLVLVAACNAALQMNAPLERDGIDLAIAEVPNAWWCGLRAVQHGSSMSFTKTGKRRILVTLLCLHTAADDIVAILAWRGGAHLVYVPIDPGLSRQEHAVGRRAGSPAVREVIAYAEAALDDVIGTLPTMDGAA